MRGLSFDPKRHDHATFSILLGSCLLLLLALSPAAARTPSAILIDADTGKILSQSNADGRTYPASLTKMMTLYLLFEAIENGKLKSNQQLIASPHAASQPPTNVALDSGDRITVDQAIRAIVVRSANDAAVVVGEALGGSESAFARIMTAKARQLGMTRTAFRNASGLPDPNQQTTARDIAILCRALIRDFPGYYPYFSVMGFTYQGRTYTTHNRMLGRYAGADGLKTGYINASGYNLATSAVRHGRRLIGVVLGGRSPRSRDAQMAGLLDRGFAATTLIARRDLPNVGGRPAKGASGAVRTTVAALPTRKPEQPIQLAMSAPATSPPAAQLAGPEPMKVATVAVIPPPKLQPLATVAMAADPVAGSDSVTVDDGADAPAPPPAVKLKSASLIVPPAKTASLVPPKTKSARRVASSGPWGVQVGAFSRLAMAKAAARQATTKAPTYLKTAVINIKETRREKSRLYRARVIGLTQQDARAACDQLRAKKVACVVFKTVESLAMSNTP